MGGYGLIRKTWASAIAALVIASVPVYEGSSAVVTVIDSFSEGEVAISSAGDLETDYQTGLSGVLGGTRYTYVQRTDGTGTSSLGVNVFPFFNQGFFISSAEAIGIGGISWGRFEPLNVNLDRDGLIFGFRVGDFSADVPGLTGTIQLTIYDEQGSEAVAKPIDEFINNPGWLHEEYSTVDFANVTRIDLDWYNFTLTGADLEFSSFFTDNNLPEPGTAILMGLALSLLVLLRRKDAFHSRRIVAVCAKPACPVHHFGASDIYAVSDRNIRDR